MIINLGMDDGSLATFTSTSGVTGQLVGEGDTGFKESAKGYLAVKISQGGQDIFITNVVYYSLYSDTGNLVAHKDSRDEVS